MVISTRHCMFLIVLSKDTLIANGFFAPSKRQCISCGHYRHQRTHHGSLPPKPRMSIRALLRVKHAHILSLQSNKKIVALDGDGNNNIQKFSFIVPWQNLWRHYFSVMRLITIVQAIGAFLVGRMVILSQQRQQTIDQSPLTAIMASISIYLSYGAGMAMNDCADAIVDSKHVAKQNRSIASKVISIRDGWIFCFLLSMQVQ